MATISGGRGWTGVVGAIAGSIVETLISGLSLIESLKAWAAARAVSAAASGVDAVPEMRRMPVPPTVDVLTSPGSDGRGSAARASGSRATWRSRRRCSTAP